MGSISKLFEKIICDFHEVEYDYRKILENVESSLSEEFPDLSIKVLLYDKKKKNFHSTNKTPVLTSEDFVSLYDKLGPLGKPFIVNETNYFPISILKKPIGCFMVKSGDGIGEEQFDTINRVSMLIMNLASLGASAYNEINPEELLKKNRSIIIGEISSGVLHDLNNIICAILGRAQLGIMKYKRSDDISDLLDSLKMVEKISKSGGKITKRLRNFSKITGKNELKEVRLSQIIESSIDILEPKLREQRENQGKSIEIENNISKELYITTDPTALEEVFFNLFNNSLDAIELEGQIEIEVEEDRFNTRIMVSDNGVGMSDDVLDKIGTMYFTTKGDNGMGVGVSAVKTLLDLQGGSLNYRSQKGQGTIAIVNLPKVKPNHKAVEEIDTEISFSPRNNEQNILLIEDNNGMREVMEELLTGYGHNVQSADSGNKGIETFASGNYDMVFLDIGLPDKSGIDVAKEIRETKQDVKIAAITGWDEDKVDKTLFDLTITKPFNINQLQEFLDTSSSEKKAEAEKIDSKTILWENISKNVI
ncbi:MAG: response regulator [Candidatus Zixiibacteriota bacterium]